MGSTEGACQIETQRHIRFVCSHCNKRFKAVDDLAGRWSRCPSCGGRIQVPRSCAPSRLIHPTQAGVQRGPKTEVRPSLDRSMPRPSAPQNAPTRPVESDQTGQNPVLVTDPSVYPWETSPSIMAKAQMYRKEGLVQALPCKVEEFLEGLLRWEVFKSIKEKARKEANLAELHVYPDLVGIVERPEKPEEPGILTRLLKAFLLFFLPFGIVGWIFNLMCGIMGLLIVLGAAIFGLFILMATLGPLTAVVAAVIFIGAGTLIRQVYTRWCKRNLDRIAARIRENPLSPYAIKQMYKRAGWIRWRTGIGRGQTGAVMAERYWQKGDVAQLVRVDARRRWMKRSLLLVVMDQPLPADPGFNRIALCLFLKRAFNPQRRIYVVDIEGGVEVADAASKAASKVLDVPVVRGQFGLLALSLVNP